MPIRADHSAFFPMDVVSVISRGSNLQMSQGPGVEGACVRRQGLVEILDDDSNLDDLELFHEPLLQIRMGYVPTCSASSNKDRTYRGVPCGDRVPRRPSWIS